MEELSDVAEFRLRDARDGSTNAGAARKGSTHPMGRLAGSAAVARSGFPQHSRACVQRGGNPGGILRDAA
jgi:hypothetical protein